jgi:hypothetical protein
MKILKPRIQIYRMKIAIPLHVGKSREKVESFSILRPLYTMMKMSTISMLKLMPIQSPKKKESVFVVYTFSAVFLRNYLAYLDY